MVPKSQSSRWLRLLDFFIPRKVREPYDARLGRTRLLVAFCLIMALIWPAIDLSSGLTPLKSEPLNQILLCGSPLP